MSRRKYIEQLIFQINDDMPEAEMIVERLIDEGVLVLGYGDSDVDKIVQKFKDTFGNTKTTKQDRFAAHRLAGKYSAQATVGIIQLLAEHSNEKYAPVANSVAQLEEKMPSVLNFLRNIKSDEVISV